jgi:hypothetical protein
MSNANFEVLLKKLNDYKKKYYLNILLRGFLLFITLLSSAYIFIAFLEYFGRFNTYYRIIFLFGFISVSLIALYHWIVAPLLRLTAVNKQISNEEASVQIGSFFPQIGDKLLNTIQLRSLGVSQNELLNASIAQKTEALRLFPFIEAVDLKENKKYLRFLFWPIIIILLILLFIPQIFVESTARIVNYNKDFAAPMPFEFLIKNKDLRAFKNEDFEVHLDLKGNSVPEQVYIISNGRRSKMKKESIDSYTFTFNNLQSSESFSFEAAGFNSHKFNMDVMNRPELKFFDVFLSYPKYLGKQNESLKSAGNLTVPEGTSITWNFNTEATRSMSLKFESENNDIVLKEKDGFLFTKRILNSQNYKIKLQNQYSESKEDISYFINVIPDQSPSINVEQMKDTVLFNSITFGGSISDDHGLARMNLHYSIKKTANSKDEKKYFIVPVYIDQRNKDQNFFFNWRIDTLKINNGETLEYFFQVWDNDGVNGSKSTKSKVFEFYLPSSKEMEKEIASVTKNTENKIEDILKKTQGLQKDLNKLEEKLKMKNNFNWQDKKLLEEVLQKQQEIKKEIEELNKLNESLNKKNEKFNPVNPETTFKIQQLQKLMEELLDEETKKLYEELQKLLQEEQDKNKLQDVLEKINDKDDNLEKEIERALEMFKQLQVEQKIDQAINKLNELSKKQEALSEKTTKKEDTPEKLNEEQKKLNEEFKEIQKDLKELKDLNESLENKNDLGDTGKQQEEVQNEQQKSSEQIQNGQNKKAGGSQKNAANKMKEMAKKMEESKAKSQGSEDQENMDALREVLENLITLSFDQEDLMKEFRKVNQTDPRFIALSQKQLTLKDDSKIIEDSLMALAKRVFQINSFVTREVAAMKKYMDESIETLKERNPQTVVAKATEKQQFAMTSINNLALMLSDVLKQMQQQMAESKKSGSGAMCKKPGKNSKPGMGKLGDLQKGLNQKLEQLKQSGKTGKEYSEELAKLAAQQEMIRNAIKDFQKKNGSGQNGALDKLSKEMEKTESDLVNKRINQETLFRQKEILTRLLEAENAIRERDIDNKRESNTGKEIKNEVPPAFEKYLKAKERQIDFLKTVSPSLNPYYKQEVNEYFQKIEK